MSLQLLCPHCQRVVEVLTTVPANCHACTAPLPDAMREAARDALNRETVPKPALLVLGQFGATLAGVIVVIVVGTAPFDWGTYHINGVPLSGPDFLREAGWLFATFGAVLLAIGVGLWRDRVWVRPLMVAYWLSLPLILLVGRPPARSEVVVNGAWTLGSGLIAVWYLYGKTTVRRYFKSVTMRRLPP